MRSLHPALRPEGSVRSEARDVCRSLPSTREIPSPDIKTRSDSKLSSFLSYADAKNLTPIAARRFERLRRYSPWLAAAHHLSKAANCTGRPPILGLNMYPSGTPPSRKRYDSAAMDTPRRPSGRSESARVEQRASLQRSCRLDSWSCL